MPPRAHRRNKRGVKRKMSSFPVRRKADRPPPSINIATAIRILPKAPLQALADPTSLEPPIPPPKVGRHPNTSGSTAPSQTRRAESALTDPPSG